MADDNPDTPEMTAEGPETGSEQPQNTPAEPEKGNDGGDDVDSLKKALAKANKDAERLRRRSDEAQSEAAKAAQSELTQKIAEALGLSEPEKADPARLTEQLTAQQAATRSAQLELAVWRAASAAEANPAALLDSRSFMSTLERVDPTDSGAVTDAIRAAVEANEQLRAVPARRVPGPNPAIGAHGTPPTPDQVLAAAERDGNRKLAAQIKAEQLLNLRAAQNTTA